MQILSLPDMTPTASVPGGGVWVLGFFDGVHAGHQKLLAAAGELAEKQGEDRNVGVWTFASLPKAEEMLTDAGERAQLLGNGGVRWLAVEDFAAVSGMSGEAFFHEVLLAHFAPSAIVCGFNFRFGHKGESTAQDLVKWGQAEGICVHVAPPYPDAACPVSSTRIRMLIREGDLETAGQLLTRPYSIAGIVEHGKALGRKLGFPTANLRLPPHKTVPARGIYACKVRFADEAGQEQTRWGVCNIGSRPTVNGDSSDVTVETWILDFSGDLYGRELRVFLYRRIREEMQFRTLEALRSQVMQDAETVRAWFTAGDAAL